MIYDNVFGQKHGYYDLRYEISKHGYYDLSYDISKNPSVFPYCPWTVLLSDMRCHVYAHFYVLWNIRLAYIRK
jgi:hypothetical protein